MHTYLYYLNSVVIVILPCR